MADLKPGRPKVLTRTDAELLATGEATAAQIAKLFRRDAKTMPRLLQGLVPAGERRGSRVYNIEEAAQRLVKPGYSIETYIKRMHPSDIPPLVQKEFWNALRARQAFEEAQGDLWRTADVVAILAESFATMRTSLMLMSDAISRETSLSPRQQEALKRLIDGAINDLKEGLVDKFDGYQPPRYGMGNDPSGDPLLDSLGTEAEDAEAEDGGGETEEDEIDAYLWDL